VLKVICLATVDRSSARGVHVSVLML